MSNIIINQQNDIKLTNNNTNELDLSSSVQLSTNSVKPENIVITDDSGNLSTLTFPRGVIIPFYGDGTVNVINQVPSGWGVCDGTNGTPDLRGRFIRCVNSVVNPSDQKFQDGSNIPIYELGDIGGSTTSSFRLNESNLPNHSHYFRNFYRNNPENDCISTNPYSVPYMAQGNSKVEDSINKECTGCQNTPVKFGTENLYYTLIYIMKL